MDGDGSTSAAAVIRDSPLAIFHLRAAVLQGCADVPSRLAA